jgi:hypothetical protein
MSRPSTYAPALLASMRAVLREPTENPRAISVTQLIDSPRVRQLYRQHHKSVIPNPDDQLWAYFGTIGHSVLEKAPLHEDCRKEVKLSLDHLDWTITGIVDLIDENGFIWDYKITSVYATKEGLKPGWVAQLNLYRWLAEETIGVKVNGLRQGVIYRDWTEREKRKSEAWYPPPAEVIEVPLWSEAQLSHYVGERLEAHGMSEKRLAHCTEDETWNGRRCARYCAVAPFCDQFKGESAK